MRITLSRAEVVPSWTVGCQNNMTLDAPAQPKSEQQRLFQSSTMPIAESDIQGYAFRPICLPQALQHVCLSGIYRLSWA